MKLKNILCFSLLSSALLMGGCSTIQGQGSATAGIPQQLKSQLSSQQAVIGYFGRTASADSCGCASQMDSTYSLTPVTDGYYRLLLGRNAKGDFLVQDFYQNTGKPQSSPAWVTEPMKLFSFDGSDVEGDITLYYPDGKVSSAFTNLDGETIKSKDYYPNGQLGSQFQNNDQGNTEYQLWYASGNKAAVYVLTPEQDVISSQAWNEDGSENDDINSVIEKVYALLDPNFQED